MTRILSVSYDQTLLSSRQMLLESSGCQVVSVDNFDEAMRLCTGNAAFDLFVIGHSIPGSEKQLLVAAFRATHHSAPVIALKKFGEEPVFLADYQIDPDPAQLLELISRAIPGGHAASA